MANRTFRRKQRPNISIKRRIFRAGKGLRSGRRGRQLFLQNLAQRRSIEASISIDIPVTGAVGAERRIACAAWVVCRMATSTTRIECLVVQTDPVRV